jgi:hypothetical protein
MRSLSRLREMPIREIGHRLRERFRIETERTLWRAKAPSASLKSFTASFYLLPEPAFVRANFPAWIEKAVREADVLCEHRLELLGFGIVDLGPEIDWHRNPVTGIEWPRRFWADYDPVNDLAYGDSKVVHELNRHQHLPRLGKAYYLTGDERYASEAIAQIESWIAQNPQGMGINWQSSLEIAIRVLSWLWTICFLLPSPAFTRAFTLTVTQSLFAQLRHVCSYLSVYSSPNTHLIGEAAALFVGGLLLDGAEARQWRDIGANLLAQTIRRQVLDDGVHCELSTGYHCYAADFYLQALILARRNSFDLPPDLPKKVEQMLEFVMQVTRPDGAIPQLGDDDGGRALALDRKDYRCYLDGLSSGAVLFGRPDFKWQSRAFQEETLWLMGSGACASYAALPDERPEGNRRIFEEAGYVVLRTGWDARDSHAVFDCGGLGAPTGGHGHADALSLVLFSNGRDVLIDSGTYVYNGAPECRDYFRSTSAHNTVVVDDCDQSRQAGTFQWQTRAEARALPAAADSAAGEHTGYPLVHKRQVHFRESGEFVIADELLGTGVHTFDFFFHFPPGADSREMLALLSFSTTVPSQAEIIEGWVSPRYGARTPANVLHVRVKNMAPLFATTVIQPFRKGAEPCAESAGLLTSIPATR